MKLREMLDNSRPANYAEEALRAISKQNNVVLFGAAEYGKIICDFLRENGVYPLCYCDNNETKVGSKWNGIDVISPVDIEPNSFIVITCNAFREITLQLQEYGFSKENILYFDVKWLTHPAGKAEFIMQHLDEFECIYNQLADEKSKKVFVNVLNYKLTYKPEYTSSVVDELQYFDSDLVKLKNDTYFIDAGSYTGDTLEAFVQYTKGNFGRVICLEPVKKNVDILQETIKKMCVEDIDILEIGASDRKQVLYFDSKSGMSARTSQTGDIRVNCDSIDNICEAEKYEHIDFIKMDIEGAEVSALKGAKRVIQKYHPILAICVYHKEDDFYTIPTLIKEIYPGYKLYFRQYELSDEETVCYAIEDK